MNKMEKHKYLAYPNYNHMAASTVLGGALGGLDLAGSYRGVNPIMPGMIPPIIPPLTAAA